MSPTPYTVHILTEARSSPDAILASLVRFFEAEKGSFIRVEPGSVRSSLEMHRGEHDVPCGLTDQDLGTTYSPLEINVRASLDLLKRGKALFQWTIEGCKMEEGALSTLLDEADWKEGTPLDEEGRTWLSVQEVCVLKDVDSPAAYRAVDTQIIDGIRTSGTLFVCPNARLEKWSPSRRKSSLFRRVVGLVREILRGEEPGSILDLYDRVTELGEERYGSQNPLDPIFLVHEQLGPQAPQSVDDWVDYIESL